MAAASAWARIISAWRRAARSTNTLTSPAATRKTTRASRFSPSATANRWKGGVKYQLASSEAETAAKSAGRLPPTAATARTVMR